MQRSAGCQQRQYQIHFAAALSQGTAYAKVQLCESMLLAACKTLAFGLLDRDWGAGLMSYARHT